MKCLQARAPRRGDGVAERRRVLELDAFQPEVGEAGEDAGDVRWKKRESAAERQANRDRGGLLEAGQLNNHRRVRRLILIRRDSRRIPVDEQREAAMDAARGGGEPGRDGTG